MNEADAYKIAAEVLHPFENKIDISTGQILADRIVFALIKVYKDGRNITSDAADGEGQYSGVDKKICLEIADRLFR